jgi:hypothetical protein
MNARTKISRLKKEAKYDMARDIINVINKKEFKSYFDGFNDGLEKTEGVIQQSLKEAIEEIEKEMEALDEERKKRKATIEEIIRACRRCEKPLFIKNNVGWKKKIQQFPDFRGDMEK